MIKVKLTLPGWPIERQTPAQLGIWEDCQFLINKEVAQCDYWVVCENLEHPEETICPEENTILVTHEPPTLGKYKTLFVKQFAAVITCHRNIKHQHPIFQQQGLQWHVGRRQRNHENLSWSKDYDELTAIPPMPKDKEISAISSGKDGSLGHRQRLDFIRILKSHFGERIDIYGRGINEIEDKWDALAGYKYHVALENCSVEDYWSEKLSDAYLARSYPIYWGCPNIEKYFHPSSMTRIDITQPDRAIHLIESTMQDNRYEKSKEHMEKARNDILNKYNLFPMICDIIHKSPIALDKAKYMRQRIMPRFAKSLDFLFRNTGYKFIRNE
jgi:hypothetical protein